MKHLCKVELNKHNKEKKSNQKAKHRIILFVKI